MAKPRTIIHFDMDSFYPSVEVLDNPDLKGKPVRVGGGKERGVVSSASYEARRFGVHSALPMASAMRLCPQGIFLPVRMERYRDLSQNIFKIFRRYTPLVEPLSIDEAFLDVTGSERLYGTAVEIAVRIRKQVLQEIGLTVSAGVAPSKFVAKIASDVEKPDGLTVVLPEKVRQFLDPLSVTRMWGVGKMTRKKLLGMNIHTFRDLSLVPVDVLERKLGSHGRKMHLLSMGIDERNVEPEHDVKSIGHEQTFVEDITDLGLLEKNLLLLSEKTARRMRKKGLTGRTISLKVKYHDFKQVTRSTTLEVYCDDGPLLYTEARRLLTKTEAGRKPVRLLGISISQFCNETKGEQLSLFANESQEEKREKLHHALDSVYRRHGEKSVVPGTLV
jgi:DNA polymerase-4